MVIYCFNYRRGACQEEFIAVAVAAGPLRGVTVGHRYSSQEEAQVLGISWSRNDIPLALYM
jgi:hypothetical protein